MKELSENLDKAIFETSDVIGRMVYTLAQKIGPGWVIEVGSMYISVEDCDIGRGQYKVPKLTLTRGT